MSIISNNIVITCDNSNNSTVNNSSIIGGKNTIINSENCILVGTSDQQLEVSPLVPTLYLKSNPVTIYENTSYTNPPTTILAADIAKGMVTITSVTTVTFTTATFTTFILDTTANILDAILNSDLPYDPLVPSIKLFIYNNSNSTASIQLGDAYQILTFGEDPIIIHSNKSCLLNMLLISNTNILVHNLSYTPLFEGICVHLVDNLIYNTPNVDITGWAHDYSLIYYTNDNFDENTGQYTVTSDGFYTIKAATTMPYLILVVNGIQMQGNQNTDGIINITNHYKSGDKISLQMDGRGTILKFNNFTHQSIGTYFCVTKI